MLFEPLDERSVTIRPHENTGLADVSVQLTERKRGAWKLSGPVGPISFAGPLQASLSSRMPAWGEGLLELSTYAASISFSAFGFSAFGHRFLPVLALERPYSPAEGWKSGFALAPQIGWRASALGYTMTQMQQRLLPVLAGDRLTRELPITMERPAGEVILFCEPPQPRWVQLRMATALSLPSMQLLGRFAAFH
jgi:hypothetical protein